ncbi:MAG: uracil phosphoribosyltransferase [Saprospiraceae bacterium]|nr:uracil phosphoribosyltransferase [Saprospiraceae bacterium]
MVHQLGGKNSILNLYLSQLRDKHIQTDSLRFRKNMERVGAIMAYEISQQLTYLPIETETPLGTAMTRVPSDKIVLGTILRAGLALHNGFLHMIDHAGNAFVSAYRKHHKDGSFDINIEYISCPNLEDTVLIISDPMIATGASIVLAYKALLEYGQPKEVHFATVIASTQGVEHVRRMCPEVQLWVGAIDDELTAKSYIVPGLGDAGDLSFGSKVQE